MTTLKIDSNHHFWEMNIYFVTHSLIQIQWPHIHMVVLETSTAIETTKLLIKKEVIQIKWLRQHIFK